MLRGALREIDANAEELANVADRVTDPLVGKWEG